MTRFTRPRNVFNLRLIILLREVEYLLFSLQSDVPIKMKGIERTFVVSVRKIGNEENGGSRNEYWKNMANSLILYHQR